MKIEDAIQKVRSDIYYNLLFMTTYEEDMKINADDCLFNYRENKFGGNTDNWNSFSDGDY